MLWSFIYGIIRKDNHRIIWMKWVEYGFRKLWISYGPYDIPMMMMVMMMMMMMMMMMTCGWNGFKMGSSDGIIIIMDTPSGHQTMLARKSPQLSMIFQCQVRFSVMGMAGELLCDSNMSRLSQWISEYMEYPIFRKTTLMNILE